MSSNNTQLNTHRKRPLHASPVPSFRSIGQERTTFVKRPRWDISSPTPSLPTVSNPGQVEESIKHQSNPFQFATTAQAFRFGLGKPAASSAAIDSSSASSSRNRVPSSHLGSNHISKHKRHRSYGPVTPPKPHHPYAQPPVIVTDPDDDEDNDDTRDRTKRLRGLERLRRAVVAEDEMFVLKMREMDSKPLFAGAMPDSASSSVETGACSGFAGSSCSPYLSQSVTSVSASTANSGDGGFDSKYRDVAGGRKRSWSVVESDEPPNDGMDMDMEWDVAAKRPIQAGILSLSPAEDHFPTPSSMELEEEDCNNITNLAYTTEDQDGDDEQEDDEDEDDSDDELVFVVSNNPHSNGAQPPSGTRRAIEELAQVMAAGSCNLEDAQDLATSGMGLGSPSVTLVDAGALWQ